MKAVDTVVAADLGTELATLLARRADRHREVVQAVTQRLWRERETGDVCADLGDWLAAGGDLAPMPAELPALCAALLASGVCAEAAWPPPASPLVLDGTRLYLRRHFVDERRILACITARLADTPRIAASGLRAVFAELGMLPAAGTVDWQLAGIAAAAARSFAVLTGGPGTGKTTTVARLLSVLNRLQPGLRTALCAPTGKAAARLGEALQQRVADEPALAPAVAAIQTATLHRLLGYVPLDDGFRRGRANPLPHDLVVVDEVSMADPALLAQLLEAVRPNARVLFVGDRDQLAAVAAGQVLGDLCRAATPEQGVGPWLGAFLRDATGMAVPTRSAAPAIADATVALRTNHRFAAQPGIGAFAQAAAARQPAAALAALRHGHTDLVLEPDADAALAVVLPAIRAAAAAREPAEALAHLRRCRVLTATRVGPHGSEAWNRRVEARLRAAGEFVDEPFYLGRPVLVTENDAQNGVWNGDLGVVAEVDGRRVVVFGDADRLRAVSLLRLPAHTTAWAMTVHKAQGSEFDEVLLAMPDQPGPLWQGALVYTGITRARRRAVVSAPPALLAAGLGLWPQRGSGLARALAT